MIYCSKCGKQQQDEAIFCGECGSKMDNIIEPKISAELFMKDTIIQMPTVAPVETQIFQSDILEAKVETPIVLKQEDTYCRTCGTKVAKDAFGCTGCGLPPLKGKSYCNCCGATTHEEAVICIKCGVTLNEPQKIVSQDEPLKAIPPIIELKQTQPSNFSTPVPQSTNTTNTTNQNVIVVGKAKSVGVAFALAFFFGPLGLLYASILGGVVMFFLGLILFFLLPIIGYILVHIGCIIWAVIAANQANDGLHKKASSMMNRN